MDFFSASRGKNKPPFTISIIKIPSSLFFSLQLQAMPSTTTTTASATAVAPSNSIEIQTMLTSALDSSSTGDLAADNSRLRDAIAKSVSLLRTAPILAPTVSSSSSSTLLPTADVNGDGHHDIATRPRRPSTSRSMSRRKFRACLFLHAVSVYSSLLRPAR